jgi:hypothetical protein
MMEAVADATGARLPREEEASAALFAGAAMLLALSIPTLAALLLDSRTLYDAGVWEKPLKFELSLAIHMITLGLLVRLIEPGARAGWGVRGLAAFTVFFSLFELLYMALQAARGRASHFNNETASETIMYALMGVGALGLVVSAFAIGVAVARRARTDIGKGLKFGAASGLMLGATLTLLVAGLMSTGMLVEEAGHWVGGARSDADALPLFGWVRSGGDLRVPHFFATHMMQGLPLLGLVADRLAPGRTVLIVVAGAAAGTAIVAATFAQALAGLPFL